MVQPLGQQASGKHTGDARRQPIELRGDAFPELGALFVVEGLGIQPDSHGAHHRQQGRLGGGPLPVDAEDERGEGHHEADLVAAFDHLIHRALGIAGDDGRQNRHDNQHAADRPEQGLVAEVLQDRLQHVLGQQAGGGQQGAAGGGENGRENRPEEQDLAPDGGVVQHQRGENLLHFAGIFGLEMGLVGGVDDGRGIGDEHRHE